MTSHRPDAETGSSDQPRGRALTQSDLDGLRFDLAGMRSQRAAADRRAALRRRQGAARQRARRARERDGKLMLTVAVDEAALAITLIDGGLIRPEDADDRGKLSHALARLIELLALDTSRVTTSGPDR